MSTETYRVRTGSRLHLGLLSVPGSSPKAGERSFGGVGLIIDEPAVCVAAEPASTWESAGPSGSRAMVSAQQALKASPTPLRIHVEACPAEHTGLGTGTQLALAAGMAARHAIGDCPDPLELAKLLGRGLRSGLGVHGFARGGFLVDGGKAPGSSVAPLIARHEFPEGWRILLAAPRKERGLSGAEELAAFAQLARSPADVAQTDSLCRLVLLGILPALVEGDLASFGEAVFEFNRRAGLLFKSSQGGEYRSPEIAGLIHTLRSLGIRAVGQSSWGPTVFAIGEPGQLENAAQQIVRSHADSAIDVRIVSARNRGWQDLHGSCSVTR